MVLSSPLFRNAKFNYRLAVSNVRLEMKFVNLSICAWFVVPDNRKNWTTLPAAPLAILACGARAATSRVAHSPRRCSVPNTAILPAALQLDPAAPDLHALFRINANRSSHGLRFASIQQQRFDRMSG